MVDFREGRLIYEEEKNNFKYGLSCFGLSFWGDYDLSIAMDGYEFF